MRQHRRHDNADADDRHVHDMDQHTDDVHELDGPTRLLRRRHSVELVHDDLQLHSGSPETNDLLAHGMAAHPVTRPRRWLQHQGGQSLVEFALSSTLFFVTVFGIITYGIAVYRYNLIGNLAQEG